MTQQGTIKKLLPNGLAEVEVTRRSACGHDCAKCGGCGGLETQTLYVTARNHAHASVGDRVLLEGETKQVLGFAAIHLLPSPRRINNLHPCNRRGEQCSPTHPYNHSAGAHCAPLRGKSCR